MPSPSQLGHLHTNNKVLKNLRDSVLIITSNYPWNHTIGLLQRMYQPYFGFTIFCGSWFPDKYSNGYIAAVKSLALFEVTYKDDPTVQAVWRQFKKGLRKKNERRDASDVLIDRDGWSVADLFCDSVVKTFTDKLLTLKFNGSKENNAEWYPELKQKTSSYK
ncbi:hypothetical protein ANCDUO_16569 [Ancylostoma duodenale]|uniref:Uncharacterized protein n=1 Tax=Ancylostoma duodenale TaxID=51022 RepID=A0A0C2G8G1_9BILA|nr:hypothetical protein ANCDUO_16569 [Ancylostoma duodenale]